MKQKKESAENAKCIFMFTNTISYQKASSVKKVKLLSYALTATRISMNTVSRTRSTQIADRKPEKFGIFGTQQFQLFVAYL